jgi:hypothetical protein
MQSSREQTVKEKISYIEQTQGIAMAEAKLTIIECMNAGKSQAVCSDKGRQAVTETFSTVQKSLFVSQNRQMQHWQMMDQQIGQTEGLTADNVYPTTTSDADWSTTFSMRTVQLYDGEEMEVLAGFGHDLNSHNDDYMVIPYYYNGEHQPNDFENYEMPYAYSTIDTLNVHEPSYSDSTGGTDTAIALSKTNYKNALTTLDQKHDGALTSVNEMATSIYANYDQGEISASEASGPLETILTQSTNNDPLTYRVQSASMAGYAVNDDGKTVTIEHDFNDDGTMETKSGVIYTDDGAIPDNTLISGKTYVFEDDGDSTTPQVSGSVMFTSNPENGTPEEYNIDSKFTVLKAYSSDGSETDSITMKDNGFNTTDTSDLNGQISELINQMEAVEEAYESQNSTDSLGGIGGVADGMMQWFTEFSTILLGILALLFAGWFFKS